MGIETVGGWYLLEPKNFRLGSLKGGTGLLHKPLTGWPVYPCFLSHGLWSLF